MNTKLFIVSCAGTLLLILNKPIGRGFNRLNVVVGLGDRGEWAFRAPLILIGLILTFLSFAPD